MNCKEGHIPVLLNEVLEGLNIKKDGIYVDCTLGGGGHASRILEKIEKGWLYCFEQDEQTKEKGQAKLASISSSFTIFPLNLFLIIADQKSGVLNFFDSDSFIGIYYDMD